MKKIGIVSNFPPKEDGIAVYAEKLYNELENSDDVEPISIGPQETCDFQVDFSKLNYVSRINEIITEEEVDIVHVQHEFQFWKDAGFQLKFISKPLIVEFHTIRHNLPYNWYSIRSRLYNWVQKILPSRSSNVIVHTDLDCEKLSANFENIEKIPLASNRTTTSKPSDLNTILFFGFMRPSKNIVELIESSEYHDVDITIAGGARESWQKEYMEKVKESAKRYDNVNTELGWIESYRKKELFEESSAVALLYDNHKDGSGVLTEAIANRRPVIAGKAPIFIEEVEKNNLGVTSEATPKEISEGIERLAESFDFYINNVEKEGQKREWNKVVEKYMEVYDRHLI